MGVDVASTDGRKEWDIGSREKMMHLAHQKTAISASR
jgi:hypothetical protein